MRSTRSAATSQIAWRSALAAFWQDSKWANCAIGPQPSTPTRSLRSCFLITRAALCLFVNCLNKSHPAAIESRAGAGMTNQSFIRNMNERRVLTLLRREGRLSRAEIARRLSLTRSAVTYLVEALLAVEAVAEAPANA